MPRNALEKPVDRGHRLAGHVDVFREPEALEARSLEELVQAMQGVRLLDRPESELVEDDHAGAGRGERADFAKERAALDVLRGFLEEDRVVAALRLEHFERRDVDADAFAETRSRAAAACTGSGVRPSAA